MPVCMTSRLMSWYRGQSYITWGAVSGMLQAGHIGEMVIPNLCKYDLNGPCPAKKQTRRFGVKLKVFQSRKKMMDVAYLFLEGGTPFFLKWTKGHPLDKGFRDTPVALLQVTRRCRFGNSIGQDADTCPHPGEVHYIPGLIVPQGRSRSDGIYDCN